MALCSLCSSLPFTNFPRFKETGIWTAYDSGHEVLVADFGPDDFGQRDLWDPIGFHENISALAESAKTCPLCGVVQAGVQAWLDSWKKVVGTDTLLQYDTSGLSGALPVDERLWLTEKPRNPSRGEKLHVYDGFCVWAMEPLSRQDGRYHFYMLTVIGFGVEESTFFPPMILTASELLVHLGVAHNKMFFSESPLKNLFPLRLVDIDSGSPCSLDRSATLVQNCIGNHQQCPDGSITMLPSRVLDIKAEGDIITLLDNVSGKVGNYACLSYCVSLPSDNITFNAELRYNYSGVTPFHSQQQGLQYNRVNPASILMRSPKHLKMPLSSLEGLVCDTSGLIVSAFARTILRIGHESLDAWLMYIPTHTSL